jgi:hypothetical protein
MTLRRRFLFTSDETLFFRFLAIPAIPAITAITAIPAISPEAVHMAQHCCAVGFPLKLG